MRQSRDVVDGHVITAAGHIKQARPEVALHGQIITPAQHKGAQLLSVFMTLLSLAAFSFGFVFKLTSQHVLFSHTYVQLTNICFSAVCLAALGIMLIMYTVNLFLIHQAKLVWTHRKRCIAYCALAQLCLQFVNTFFFLAPNVHSLAKICSWFDNFTFASATVRWTCWNTLFFLIAVHTHNLSPWLDEKGNIKRGLVSKVGNVEGPLIVMDASYWVHWPKFLFCFKSLKVPLLLSQLMLFLAWQGLHLGLRQFTVSMSQCCRCCFEFCIIWLATGAPETYDYGFRVVPSDHRKHPNLNGRSVPCYDRKYDCSPGTQYKVFTSLWIVFVFLYVFMIAAYIYLARKRLLKGRYNEFVAVHLMILRQKKQMWYLAYIGVLTMPVLWYTRWLRCNNYFVAWLGLLPLQVTASSVIAISSFYFMPVSPGNKSIHQAWLQDFAWLEEDYSKKLKARAEGHDPEVQERLLKEPLFCFERALKMALWSELVYTHQGEGSHLPVVEEAISSKPQPASHAKLQLTSNSSENLQLEMAHIAVPIYEDEEQSPIKSKDSLRSVPSRPSFDGENRLKRGCIAKLQTGLSHVTLASMSTLHACQSLMDAALEMYSLHQYEIIHEKTLESRALIAWNANTMVISFRGTCSKANMWSDAKAWRTRHPPARGNMLLWTQPLVHRGFMQTWRVNNFGERVLKRASQLMESGKVTPEEFQVLITGHSLGGALATLAAIDLQKKFNLRLKNLHVYTFGSPRTGNHAFAREYETLVPHTWHIINESDAVPASMKFYILYKRAGQRALINECGDLRIRPSAVELTIQGSGYSIKKHFMASYLKSLWSICESQLKAHKAEPGGRQGIAQLSMSLELQTYFATLGKDLQALGQGSEACGTTPNSDENLDEYAGSGVVDFANSLATDIIEDIRQKADAALSLVGGAREKAVEDALHQEEEQSAPESLEQRLSSLNQQLSILRPR